MSPPSPAGAEDEDDDDDGHFKGPAPSGAVSASTARTLGGAPVPIEPTVSSSAAAGSSSASGSTKKSSEMRSTQRRTFGTLGSLARDRADSDDDDKGQDFYTGGEKRRVSYRYSTMDIDTDARDVQRTIS